jgi:proline iminopeptidase
MNKTEGFVSVEGGRVWYRSVGSGGIPLLLLHGGPGAGHDYLEPLEMLAADRQVVFYDQLGCGRSDRPDNSALWRIERFVTEVAQLRRALGLSHIHLLGHSWGGWLAIEYLLSQPAGVVSVVLASTSASLPEVVTEIRRLRSKEAKSCATGSRDATRDCWPQAVSWRMFGRRPRSDVFLCHSKIRRPSA